MAMPISVTCPASAAPFRVPHAMAGKQVVCPMCQHAFLAPRAGALPQRVRAPGKNWAVLILVLLGVVLGAGGAVAVVLLNQSGAGHDDSKGVAQADSGSTKDKHETLEKKGQKQARHHSDKGSDQKPSLKKESIRPEPEKTAPIKSGAEKPQPLQIKQIYSGQTADYIWSLAFSPDGKTLALGAAEVVQTKYVHYVQLWDVASHQVTRTLCSAKSGPINSLAFHPDGQTLLVGYLDAQAILWDVAAGKKIKTLNTILASPNSGAFSRDGQTLALANINNDPIQLVNLRTGKSTPLQEGANTVVFLPDGKTLASAVQEMDGRKTAFKLWNLADNKTIATVSIDDPNPYAFSWDGKILATGASYHKDARKSIKLWDAASGKHIGELPHPLPVLAVAFSRDGTHLATVSFVPNVRQTTITLWELSGGDTHRLGVVDSGTGPKRKPVTLTGKGWPIRSIAFAKDGKTLAAGGGGDKAGGGIQVWDVATHQAGWNFDGYKYYVAAVAFSPDGKTLATGSFEDATVKLWDVATGKNTTTLDGVTGTQFEGQPKDANWRQFQCVAFSPDGKTLAARYYAGGIMRFDLATGQRIGPGFWWERDLAMASSLTYSPDGKTLATGGLFALTLWDVAGAKMTATTKIQKDNYPNFWSVAFSPDGKTLATVSAAGTRELWQDGTIKLWDVATFQCTATFSDNARQARCVAFSPDGKTLASGSNDGTVKLWDATTGKLLKTYTGHTKEVTSLAFHPGGHLVASGSMDGTVKLWDVSDGGRNASQKQK